jgi:hypothetical protein
LVLVTDWIFLGMRLLLRMSLYFFLSWFWDYV